MKPPADVQRPPPRRTIYILPNLFTTARWHLYPQWPEDDHQVIFKRLSINIIEGASKFSMRPLFHEEVL